MMNSHREQVEVIAKLGVLQHPIDSAQARQGLSGLDPVWRLPSSRQGAEARD